MIFQWIRQFSISPVGNILPMVSVDPALGPFPSESVVSRALHEAALRRLAEVQLALRVVVGDTTALVVEPDRYERVIVIRWHGESSSVWLDVDVPAPEPDEPTQFERDVDVIADELSESRAFWGRRLPECPLHPDSHALLIDIGPDAATVRCPVSGDTIRTVPR